MARPASIQGTWRLLRPHVLPRLPLLGVVVLLGTLTAVAQSSALVLIEPLWELVIFADQTPRAESSTSVVLEGFLSLRDSIVQSAGVDPANGRTVVLLCVVGFLLLSALVSGLSQYGFIWLSRRVSLGMVVDLRLRLAAHLTGLSLQYHGKRGLGDLLSRISADVQTTLLAIDTGIKRFIQEPAYVVLLLGIAVYNAPLLSVGLVLSVPLLIVPVRLLSRRVRKRSSQSLTSLGASVQALAQLFQGIRTVKAFRAEERELERYRELNTDYVRHSMRLVRSVALARAWTHFFGLAGMAALLLVAGWLTIRFNTFDNPARMLGFFLAVTQISSHVKHLVKALTLVDESVGASDRLANILEESTDVVEATDPIRLEGLREGLVFEGVHFSYPDSEGPALRGIDLELRLGETLALVGPSGSGKSTLLDLVCRFFDPTAGCIRVDGHELRSIGLDCWTSLYAVVGQTPFLFHTSIEENLRYGKPDATAAEVEAAARAANIHEFIESLPNGYQTSVEEAGERLSGGQRQRITIARALLKSAPLLLLDEATSSLDSESEAAVQEALERLMVNRTVVVIAHRLATIRNADRIAVLDEGRIVELGSHEELLSAEGPYARLVSLQQLPSPAPTGP